MEVPEGTKITMDLEELKECEREGGRGKMGRGEDMGGRGKTDKL